MTFEHNLVTLRDGNDGPCGSTHAQRNITPDEARTGIEPTITELWVFCCIAMETYRRSVGPGYRQDHRVEGRHVRGEPLR